ncbi:MAG: RIO1 family regulatory kinase/ATPase [Promethearchaeota archaeon]
MTPKPTYVSQRSWTQRQSAKEGGARGRYQEIPEITLASVRADAFASTLATEVVKIISAGKEATVYLALWREFPLALKVYRFHRTVHSKHGKLGYAQDVVSYWAAREYWILDRAFRAGVKVPTPARHSDHMFTARFLGEDRVPAPLLKDSKVEYPKRTFDCIIEQIFKLYRTYLIHGDLSPFNILMHKEEPWIIDFPQAIDFASRLGRHQTLKSGRSILLRDLRNVVKYFQHFGITADPETLLEECMSQVGLHDRFDKRKLRR